MLLLQQRGSATSGELAQASGLPPRTLRFATHRLQDLGLIRRRATLGDCRRCSFSLVQAKAPAQRRPSPALANVVVDGGLLPADGWLA